MWTFLRRKQFEAELDAELRDHIRKYADDLMARGVPALDAETQARREFGGVALLKEEARESSGLAWFDGAARNLRFAVRILRKNPAFSLTAIATLALCIGANTAIFSVVDAMLFRPLPYPEPDRLGMISVVTRGPDGGYESTSVDGSTAEFLRDGIHSIDAAVHSRVTGVNLASPSGARYADQMRVSAGFFRVLGVAPMLGREIEPEEDVPGGPAVVVLNESLWQAAFGADRTIVGKSILLRGEPYVVIGVMPPGFNTVWPADVWTPLRPTTRGEGGGANFGAVARVRPGFTREQAEAELTTAPAENIVKDRPKSSSVRLHFISVKSGTADALETPALLLWGAVGLVLLIGCVNVAGLLLARGSSRRHEIATRMALGSGRRGIIFQLGAESLLLAAISGMVGIGLGRLSLEALRPLMLAVFSITQPVSIDGRVLLLTAVVALLTSLAFGLYPAIEASRSDVRSALASSSRTASAHRGAWMRRGLVAGQVALSAVLLVSAGLVLRTLHHLTSLNSGFDSQGVMTANLSLQDARYKTPAAVTQLFDRSLIEIRRTPGVEAAGVGLTLPYERALNSGVRVVDGPNAAPRSQTANVTYVTPGYFEALRMNLLQGRRFDQGDLFGAPLVAVVNEAYVRYFMRDDRAPLGRHLGLGGPVYEIVGIIGDVQQRGAWGNFGPVGPMPQVYVPAAQFVGFELVHTWFSPSWVVRASGPQAQTTTAMRAAVARIDAQLPFAGFRTMDEVRSRAFGLQRAESILFGSLAALALLLAAVGIYGLIAHSVAERTREFGIRIALGSSAWAAVREAARPAVVLTACGIAAGYFLSRWSGRLLGSMLWGVEPDDAVTFIGVAVTLLLVAGLAGFLPSVRIARLDPSRTLREE